ncbi:MAG: hypothetical protein A2Z91_06975 [Deltaproteobacteria bacterium GWA2_38_16]|nr:MAG: hypothetical protein A2Z91_06975 [Deltaproteobacteria bacterium GWA2_38_16]OGQ02386.1 MAG: hypothetical protein A3D19_06050 [Deltaproteobacteria bacterium RIFCSPHIGHO2_02_FULL_38_15]
MSLILQVFFVCFLAVSCATVSKPEPEALPSSENGENGQKGLEEEDVVVKEISQTLTLEKTVDNLYDNAYQSYLNGKYEDAIIGFETGELLNSQKMQFWRKLSLNYCYLATGRYKDAQNLALLLINEKPDYWKSYMNAALAYLWQGKFQNAIEHFQKADEFQDAEPSVELYLGIAYKLLKKEDLAQKQFVKAEESYREIMKNNPDDEQAFIELAYLYLYSDKNNGEVLRLLDKAKRIVEDSDKPEEKQIWLDFYLPHLKGMFLYKEEKFEDSILTLTSALEKSPSGIHVDLAEVYYYLGKNYKALKNDAKAQEFFKKALEIDPLVLYTDDIQTQLNKVLKPKSPKTRS